MLAPMRSPLPVAALVVQAAACVPNLSLPHADTQVACTRDEQCPATFRCNLTTELCIPASRDDLTAPGVCAAQVTGEPGPAGFPRSVLRLVVSEPLAAAQVYFVDGRQRAFNELILQDEEGACGDEPGWVYQASYLPEGDERENVEHPLQAVLEDEVGNRATTTLPATVRFDFTPPEVLEEPAPSVAVIPNPANPVAVDVLASQAAGPTSQVLITFTTSEPVTVPVVSTRPTAEIAFELVVSTGISHTFELNWAATQGDHQDTFALVARLTDLAGNQHTQDLPGVSLHVDTVAPPSPAVQVPGALQLMRAPWGTAASAAPRYELWAAAGATEPHAWLQVFASETSPGEVGRGQADHTGGAAPIALAMPDQPAVWVRSVDAAGNVSPRVPIQQVVWAATLGGKVAGSSFGNPHRYYSTPVLPAGRERGLWTEQGGDRPGALDQVAQATVGGGAWTRVMPAWEGAVAFAAAAYDPLQGQILAFGGASGVANVSCANPSAVTRLRGPRGDWSAVSGGSLVEPDQNATVVYDGAREELLLMGGAPYGLFRWGGAAGWTPVFDPPLTTLTAPCEAGNARWRSVYDPLRRLVYFTNGLQLYAWDGASFTPLCRTAACLAGPHCPIPMPEGAGFAALTFDENLGEVLLFGAGTHADETWSFNGERWQQLCTSEPCLGSRPPGRRHPGLVFDGARGEAVLFGGEPLGEPDGPSACNSLSWMAPGEDPLLPPEGTWTFNGDVWVQHQPPSSPPARYGHVMVYDAARQRVVINGGTDCRCYAGPNGYSRGVFSDTWEWDGQTWTNATRAPSPGWTRKIPEPATQHAMTTDPVTAEPLMEGGGLDGLYRWRAGAWEHSPNSTSGAVGGVVASPTPPAAAPNPHAEQVVRYGGFVGGSITPPTTEVFTGAGWSLGCETDPCLNGKDAGQRGFHAAASDGDTLVMFGGGGPFGGQGGTLFSNTNNHTYLWEPGQGWTQVCTGGCTRPSARARHAMAYAGANTAILFGGGVSALGVVGETWLFEGGGWTQATPTTSPPARGGHVLVWDASRQAVMLAFGSDVLTAANGSTHDIPLEMSEVWEWSQGEWRQVRTGHRWTPGSPAPRYGAAAAYSASEEAAIVHGGTPSPRLASAGIDSQLAEAHGDTWLWDGGTHLRPAQRLEVEVGAAEGAVSPLRDNLTGLELTWYGTATGWTPQGATQDAELALWDGQGWRVLPTSACGEGCLRYRAEDDTALGSSLSLGLWRYLHGELLRLRVAPRGTNGPAPGRASLETDFVEVRLSYQRP